MDTTLERLQTWFIQQCNDDWEHQRGIKIDTLDNPGWSVAVDLEGTSLLTVPFKEIKTERTELDWIHCRVQAGRFEGFGGPTNLAEILETFLQWAEGHTVADAT